VLARTGRILIGNLLTPPLRAKADAIVDAVLAALGVPVCPRRVSR